MFGDPVRNEMGWEKIKIGEIASIRIGPFGSLLHAEDYVKDGIPLINPSNMVDGKIVPDKNLSLSQEKYNELKNYHLERNDVVVARRGEIGRCAIVETDSHLFCGTGSMFVRITKKYYPIFLQFQIYQTSLKDFLESKSKGVTMKNLNSKILSQLKVLKPPLELQTEFVTIVEKVEALKEKYQNSLNDLETLYGALSQKAFKGELDLSRIAISEELKPKDIKMDAPQVRNPDLTVQDESVKTQETREQFLMSGRRTEKTRTIF
jgi:type I restriction enzyme S subunit